MEEKRVQVPLLVRGESLFALSLWPGGGWSTGVICVTATIFTCEFVVTTANVGVMTVGIAYKNPGSVHNCPSWKAISCYEHGKVLAA